MSLKNHFQQKTLCLSTTTRNKQSIKKQKQDNRSFTLDVKAYVSPLYALFNLVKLLLVKTRLIIN